MNNTCTHMDVHLHNPIPMSIGKTYADLSSFACIGEMHKEAACCTDQAVYRFPAKKKKRYCEAMNM